MTIEQYLTSNSIDFDFVENGSLSIFGEKELYNKIIDFLFANRLEMEYYWSIDEWLYIERCQ